LIVRGKVGGHILKLFKPRKKMENIKISPEMAKGEVQKWLELRRLKKSKIDSSKEMIEVLEDAFLNNLLILEDDKLIQKLEFPLINEKGEITIKELVYTKRLTQQKITQATEGISASNFNAILSAYVSAITAQPKAIIGALDTDDFATSRAIATFFM